MRPRSRWARASRAIEGLLVVVGVVFLAAYGWFTFEARRLESQNRAAVARLLSERVIVPEAPGSTLLEAAPSPDFVGALDIPSLHVSAAVRAGDDEDALDGAIGYLPDTPPPWAHGNTALAAHRDRLFRALAGIRAGDEIFLWTTHGDFRYAVIETFVVNPTDVWVIDDADGVDLTLITCYPFVYVGHAPKRFVVRARKSDVVAPLTYRN